MVTYEKDSTHYNIYITYYRASRYNGGELEVTYYDANNEQQTETNNSPLLFKF